MTQNEKKEFDNIGANSDIWDSFKDMLIGFSPIGVIRSPFKELKGMPIQPAGAKDVEGQVILFPEYKDGLKDLDGFSHIILIYFFHKAFPSDNLVNISEVNKRITIFPHKDHKLQNLPYMEDVPHGIFAIRAPKRPNPIGISIVPIKSVEDNIIRVNNIDVLDNTPLLDIKPFVPGFDLPFVTDLSQIKIGWLGKQIHKVHNQTADDRYL